jgi:hypothetical protein
MESALAVVDLVCAVLGLSSYPVLAYAARANSAVARFVAAFRGALATAANLN